MNNTKPRLAKYDNTIVVNGIRFHNLEAAQEYYMAEYEGGKGFDVAYSDGSTETWNY